MAMEKDKSFDQIIKEKLQGIQPKFEAQSWDLFEQKLETREANTPQVDNTLLDRVIYDRLFSYEVPYDASTWKLLSARLDEELNFTTQILRYKAIELVMMLLAIFTLFQYLPEIKNNQVQTNSHSINTTEQIEMNGETTVINKEETKSLVGNPQSPSKNDIHSASVPEPTSTVKTAITQNSQSLVVPPVEQLFPSHLTSKSDRENQNAIPIHVDIEKSKAENLQQDFTIDEPKSYSLLEPFNTIASRGFHLLDFEEEALQLPIIKPLRLRKSRVTIGIFGSINYDIISLPPLEGDKKEAIPRYARSYAGGLNVNIEKRKWGLGLGAIYSVKSYKTDLEITTGGIEADFLQVNLAGVKLQLLEIPLQLHYNILAANRWRMYVFGGPNIQLLFSGNYFGKNEHFVRRIVAPSQPGQSGTNIEPVEKDDISGISAGLLHQGSFKDNVYLAGRVGFGIERRVSQKWSLFAQPTYQFPIKHWNEGFGFELENAQYEGIGSLREKFKTLSLVFGLKVGI